MASRKSSPDPPRKGPHPVLIAVLVVAAIMGTLLIVNISKRQGRAETGQRLKEAVTRGFSPVRSTQAP